MEIGEALAGTGDPPVIWLQGQSCSGCSVSLLNSIEYGTIDDVLLNKISLEYHTMIMAAAGDFAVSAIDVVRPTLEEIKGISSEWLTTGTEQKYNLNGDSTVNMEDFALLAKRKYILVVEGAIPTGAGGAFCHFAGQMNMIDALGAFAENASHIIAVGTCASFGGFPADFASTTGALSVTDALTYLGKSKPVINVPGCSVHPDWIIGTIIHLLMHGQAPPLDSDKRPLQFFPEEVLHYSCPRYGAELAQQPGDPGCLFYLGCKGPDTHADCSLRKWNSGQAGQPGVNWCIGAGTVCIGCTQRGFPYLMLPFHGF